MHFISKYKMWSKNAISNFSFAKIFLWIRFYNHAWSFHHLCFDCLIRIISKWRMFDKNDSSNFDQSDSLNMNDISSSLINDVSSNLTKYISLNLINNISSNLMTISHQTWWIMSQQVWWLYLIKFWRTIFH